MGLLKTFIILPLRRSELKLFIIRNLNQRKTKKGDSFSDPATPTNKLSLIIAKSSSVYFGLLRATNWPRNSQDKLVNTNKKIKIKYDFCRPNDVKPIHSKEKT